MTSNRKVLPFFVTHFPEVLERCQKGGSCKPEQVRRPPLRADLCAPPQLQQQEQPRQQQRQQRQQQQQQQRRVASPTRGERASDTYGGVILPETNSTLNGRDPYGAAVSKVRFDI